ncbi:MAG: NAD-dependent epimerase/dehydratase family protein, partial [Candidatus Hydrogenedentota bacterium]
MAKNKKKVLVTGGRGFSGSYLVDELLKKGISVIVLDREQAFSPDRDQWIQSTDCVTHHENLEKVAMDLLNEKDLRHFFKDRGKEIDAIFHTASLYDYS